jgi:hypothetical protein
MGMRPKDTTAYVQHAPWIYYPTLAPSIIEWQIYLSKTENSIYISEVIMHDSLDSNYTIDALLLSPPMHQSIWILHIIAFIHVSTPRDLGTWQSRRLGYEDNYKYMDPNNMAQIFHR